MKKLLLLFALLPYIALSQVKDIDGNSYHSIKIGKQEWMVENLNVKHYRNGDPISEVQANKKWIKTDKKAQPAWCYFDNNPENGEKYGKLYNYYAVNDPRGLAPTGWHIPTEDEWKILIDYLGGELESGNKLKSTTNWFSGGNGSDESGFTALSGGARSHDASFQHHKIGYYSYWWSSSEYNSTLAWYRYLSFNSSVLKFDFGKKNHGLYVRCIKD